MALMLAVRRVGPIALHHRAFHLAIHLLAAILLARVTGTGRLLLILLVLGMLRGAKLGMIHGSSRRCLRCRKGDR
jgi:hypothetical protein